MKDIVWDSTTPFSYAASILKESLLTRINALSESKDAWIDGKIQDVQFNRVLRGHLMGLDELVFFIDKYYLKNKKEEK